MGAPETHDCCETARRIADPERRDFHRTVCLECIELAGRNPETPVSEEER